MNDIKNQVLKKVLDTSDTATLKAVSDVLDGKSSGQRDEDRYLNVEEALHYLGSINRTTLWKARKAGKLREYHLGTRRLFRRKDLDRLLTCKKISGGGTMDTS